MNYTYVSLGAQCATPLFFKKIGVKNQSLPFDWMFSTPEFIYTILKFLFVDNMDIHDIVTKHFFVCDKRATLHGLEKHITDTSGPILVNTKYDVCFPHDMPHETEKYIRRIARLKELILDKQNYIYFMYISVSSTDSGNYTLDGKEPIKDLYPYLHKISQIIGSVRDNYKIVVFDTNIPNDVIITDEHIVTNKLQPKNEWGYLLNEVQFIYDVMVINKEIMR